MIKQARYFVVAEVCECGNKELIDVQPVFDNDTSIIEELKITDTQIIYELVDKDEIIEALTEVHMKDVEMIYDLLDENEELKSKKMY